MDQGNLNEVIFLDLKKAFESTDHDILLMKMKLYGLTEHFLKWFRSYLTNRILVCKVDHMQPKQTSIKYRVPQGSILELLLFLFMLMISQTALHALPQVCLLKIKNLSTRRKSITEIEDKLYTDLENVRQWLMANKLTLSKDKTGYMVIGSR